MQQDEITEKQLNSAKKGIEWMQISKPSVGARTEGEDGQNCHRTGGGEQPSGIALPPHERDCGRAHPMRGTNSEDLTDWCIRHQT